MSDVEFMTQRNWEQRRHAEEYDARLEEEERERERQDLEDAICLTIRIPK